MEQNAGANKPQSSQMIFMLISLFMMIALFLEPVRNFFGKIVGFVLEPIIGFNGEHIVVTLMLAGMLMIGLSTIVRSLLTDTMKQAKNQNEMKAFNAELRKARIENNLYKIKKLTEQQQAMMAKSMESSMKMMKTMPITMLIVMPIISWIWIFLYALHEKDPSLVFIKVPWADAVDLTQRIVVPFGLLLYMLVTIPFGQIVSRSIRWFQYKKRLENLEGQGTEIA